MKSRPDPKRKFLVKARPWPSFAKGKIKKTSASLKAAPANRIKAHTSAKGAFRNVNKAPAEDLTPSEMIDALFTPEFKAFAESMLGEYSFQEAGDLFKKNLALYVYLSKGKRHVGDTASVLAVTRQHVYHLLPEWVSKSRKRKPRSK